MKLNNHQTLDNAKPLKVEAKKENGTVRTENPNDGAAFGAPFSKSISEKTESAGTIRQCG
jgi:hypothetical protein